MPIASSWKKFNKYTAELEQLLGRSGNIIGEYAEHIANQYVGGTLLRPSHATADIEGPGGELYQIKSRRIRGQSLSTQLNVIRSWDFDYLVVILFDAKGSIIKGVQVPVSVAKEYAKPNKHQNGWVITTSKNFLNDRRSRNIEKELSLLNE